MTTIDISIIVIISLNLIVSFFYMLTEKDWKGYLNAVFGWLIALIILISFIQYKTATEELLNSYEQVFNNYIEMAEKNK